jgi:hypothetical protein
MRPAFALQGEPDHQWIGQNVEARDAKIRTDKVKEGLPKSEGTEIFNAIR